MEKTVKEFEMTGICPLNPHISVPIIEEVVSSGQVNSSEADENLLKKQTEQEELICSQHHHREF